jgi:Enoyl-CoA hydratase/isomerase
MQFPLSKHIANKSTAPRSKERVGRRLAMRITGPGVTLLLFGSIATAQTRAAVKACAGELVGAIAIYSYDVRPFTDKQVALLNGFAKQAVIAIENVRLLNELRARTDELARSVEELQALGQVSQAVNSTLDLETYVKNYAGMISANAPLTVHTAKYTINEAVKDESVRNLAHSAELVERCFASNDYAEGRRAFMEKRKPVFTGT